MIAYVESVELITEHLDRWRQANFLWQCNAIISLAVQLRDIVVWVKWRCEHNYKQFQNKLLIYKYYYRLQPKNQCCISCTVPIPKCDGRKKYLTVDDFRGISISPVLFKLFELCVSDRYSDYFTTSDNQFGFKKHTSYSHVVYSVRNVIDHYVCTTVYVCTLDLSKAYDRMNHYTLFTKLIKRNLPFKL